MYKIRKTQNTSEFMEIKAHKLSLLCLLIISLIIMVGFDSCKSRRHRIQEKERNESTSYRRSERKTERREKREIENKDYKVNRDLAQSDRIQEIAESGDIDAMLKCMENAVAELRQLRKDYFASKLTDREAQERLEEIEQKYQPVMDSLHEAESNGDLRYKDHKKQMKLIAQVFKEFAAAVNTLQNDFVDAFK